MSSLTQAHQVFLRCHLSNSFNFPRHATFDPVIIIFSFNMSKPPQPAKWTSKTKTKSCRNRTERSQQLILIHCNTTTAVQLHLYRWRSANRVRVLYICTSITTIYNCSFWFISNLYINNLHGNSIATEAAKFAQQQLQICLNYHSTTEQHSLLRLSDIREIARRRLLHAIKKTTGPNWRQQVSKGND